MTRLHRFASVHTALALPLVLCALIGVWFGYWPAGAFPMASAVPRTPDTLPRAYQYPAGGCLGRILDIVNVATHPNLGNLFPNALVPRGTVVQVVGTAEQQQWQTGPACSSSISPLPFAWSATYQANDGGAPVDATGSIVGTNTLTPTLNANNAGTYVVTLQSTGPVITAQLSIQVVDSGSRWINIGPDRTPILTVGGVSGRVNALEFDRTRPGTLYAGTAQGGVWKSGDYGASWRPLMDNKGLPSLGVGALASAPDGSALYAGTGDPLSVFNGNYAARPGKGVYKSTDGGVTWNATGGGGPGCAIPIGSYPPYTNTHRIVVDPANASRVYAATDIGVFRSDDAGDCWASIQGAIPGLKIDDLEFEPGDSTHLYLISRASGVYDTVDPAAPAPAWTLRKASPCGTLAERSALAVSPAAPAMLYADFACKYPPPSDAVTAFRYTIEPFGSSDRGSTWAALPNTLSPAQSWYNFDIAADPGDANTVYHAGGGGLWKYGPSTGGQWVSWNGPSASPPTPNAAGRDIGADQHALAFDPNNPRMLYLATDAGIYRYDLTPSTAVAPANWTDLNRNLAITQIYRLNVDPSWQGDIGGGTQDNNSQRRIGTGRRWALFIGGTGDGGPVGFDAAVPPYPYPPAPEFVTTYVFGYGGILRYDPTGQAPYDATKGFGRQVIGAAADFYSDPFRPGVMLAISPRTAGSISGGQLFYAGGVDTAVTANWTCIDPTPTQAANDVASAVAFARVLPTGGSAQYYVGTNLGMIYLVSVPASPPIYPGCGAGSSAGTATPIYTGSAPIQYLAEDAARPCLLYATATKASDPASRVVRLEGTATAGGCGGWSLSLIGSGLPSDLNQDGPNPNGPGYSHPNPVAADPLSSTLVYIGSDRGLWVGHYDGPNWTWSRSLDVPDTTVSEIKAHVTLAGSFGTLYAATFGRGVYERVLVTNQSALAARAAPAASANTITRCQVREFDDPGMRWQIADVEVDYNYAGDHGSDVRVRPAATAAGVFADYFIRETQQVYTGAHTANLQLIYGAADAPPGLTTDGVQVELYETAGSGFASAACDLNKIWRRSDARVLDVQAREPDAEGEGSELSIAGSVPITVTLSNGAVSLHHTPFSVVITQGLVVNLQAPALRKPGDSPLAFERWTLSTHAQDFESPLLVFTLAEDTGAFVHYRALDHTVFLPVLER